MRGPEIQSFEKLVVIENHCVGKKRGVCDLINNNKLKIEKNVLNYYVVWSTDGLAVAMLCM